VWVADERLVWVHLPLLLLDADRGIVEVVGKGELKLNACHIVDESHLVDREDLCGMNRLHEAPLLDTIRRRFIAGKIYTTTDSVLLSINPYEKIEGLYDRPCLYLDIPVVGEQANQRGGAGQGGLPPHVFRIANDALASMVVNAASAPDLLESSSRHFVNQSLIISGESGAGKTEASKLVMVFLIAADGEMSDSSSDVGEEIKEELLCSNVVFEAFGNAKTIRNDNSSRFGKFIRLLYNSDNRIVSAVTETFLLEKSRLVELGVGERCYHVFYILVAGLPQLDAALAQELKLQQQQPAAFPMLRDRAGATHASEGDASLPALAAALAKVGFSAEELSCLWSLLASILHMSNVTLKESKGDGGPVEASCSSMPLDSVAKLLGLDADSLLHALTEQTIQAGGRASMHSKRLGPAESRNNLLALSKFLYSSVFDFLLRKVNHAHAKGAGGERFIGVLDIFGCESELLAPDKAQVFFSSPLSPSLPLSLLSLPQSRSSRQTLSSSSASTTRTSACSSSSIRTSSPLSRRSTQRRGSIGLASTSSTTKKSSTSSAKRRRGCCLCSRSSACCRGATRPRERRIADCFKASTSDTSFPTSTLALASIRQAHLSWHTTPGRSSTRSQASWRRTTSHCRRICSAKWCARKTLFCLTLSWLATLALGCHRGQGLAFCLPPLCCPRLRPLPLLPGQELGRGPWAGRRWPPP